MCNTLYCTGFVLKLAEGKQSITNPCNTSTVHSCVLWADLCSAEAVRFQKLFRFKIWHLQTTCSITSSRVVLYVKILQAKWIPRRKGISEVTKHFPFNFMFMVPCIANIDYERPTRCNNKQSIFYFTARSLYMFRVPFAPIISSTWNCSYSHWYKSYISASWEA